MQEFDNLIKHCAQKFNTIPFCSHCAMSQCRKCGTNTCYNCLTHIHSIHTKNEHYSCEKITYNYILKHGYRYVSEMAWAFWDIKSEFDKKSSIDILSIGCGPSTELYGAVAIYKDKILSYSGFDLSNTWQAIQQYNIDNFKNQSHTIKYFNYDFVEYIKDNDVGCDILVLNYFLSDFIKYHPQNCKIFINNLVNLTQEGRFPIIIINDVMLLYSTGTGYACMEEIAKQLRQNQNFSYLFQRRHFATPNQFQFEYGNKHENSIGFKPIIQEAMPFDPFETCGSIQLIIKTKKK